MAGRSENNNPNILLLDDSLLVRIVIKRLFAAYFQGFNLYTASDNLQGLGLAYALDCKVLIVDTTLPKYDGKDVIEYVRTNERFKQSNTQIIVLYRDGIRTEDFDSSVVFIDKDNGQFLSDLLSSLSRALDVSIEGKQYSKYLRILRFLGRHIINKEDQSVGHLFSTVKSKSIFAKIGYLFLWGINQFVSSLYLLLFYIVGGREIKEANIDQDKLDLTAFRRRYYPTMVVAMVSFLVVVLQGGIIATTFIAVESHLTARTLAASTRTWDGGGVDNNWSTCANWSSDICPIAGDTVIFDGTSTKDGTIDVNYGGNIIVTISSGYTGTLTQAAILSVSTWTQSDGHYQGATQNLTISTFTLNAGGDFNGGGSTTNISGAFTMNGGTFTATTATMALSGNFSILGGTFNANGGTLSIAGFSGTLSCNNATFNFVVMSFTGSKTVNGNCNLPLGNNPTIGSTGTLTLNGILSGTGTLTKSQGDIVLNSGAALSGFTGLTKSSNMGIFITGADLDFSSYTTFNVTNVTVTSGSVALAPSLSTGTLTVNGGTVLPTTGDLTSTAFTFSSGTVTAPSGIWSISANINISAGTTFNANGGTIKFTGTSTTTCNNTTFNSVVFNNSGSVTVGADCTFPLGASPTLAGAGGVAVNGTLTGSGVFTKTAGILTVNSTAAFTTFTNYVVSSITIAGATFDRSADPTFVAGGLVTLSSGTLSLPTAGADINGGLTITGGTFNASSGITTVAQGLSISGSPTFNANGGTLTFDGGTATLNCNNVTFNAVSFTGQTSTKTVSNTCTLPLGNNPIIPNSINLAGTLMGSGTITATGGTFNFNAATGNISGFTAAAFNILTVSGATLDFSAYTSFSVNVTFTLSSGSVTMPNLGADLNGDLNISGGTFTASSGTMTLAGSFTVTGTPTFNANGGTISFDSNTARTINCNGISFNNVTIPSNSASAYTISNGCTVPLGNNPSLLTSLTVNGTITGSGKLTVGTFTRTVIINSTGNLSGFTDLDLPNFTVAGATVDLTSYDSVAISGALTLSSGSLTMTPGLDLTSLTITGGTFNAPDGDMGIKGNLTISGSSIFNANDSNIIFDGSTSGTLSCNNVAFNKVSFNSNNSKTVNSNCQMDLGDDPTLLGNGTVTLNGTFTGSGTFTKASGTFSLNTTGIFTGFDELDVNTLSMTGADRDFSGYNSITATGTVSLSSGSFVAAPINNFDALSITGGTFSCLPGSTLVTEGFEVKNSAMADTTGCNVDAYIITTSGTATFTAPGNTLTLRQGLNIGAGTTFNVNNTDFAFRSPTSGIITSSISCNNLDLHNVSFDMSNATITVNSNCDLPLGDNPVIGGTMTMILKGTLHGTGTLSKTDGLLTLEPGTVLSGFDALNAKSLKINGANVDFSSYASLTTTQSFDIESGSFVAPALMTVGGTWIKNGGSFSHNDGTVNLNGSDDFVFSGTNSNTFYNLTKTVTSAHSVTFQSGVAQNIVGQLTLTGTSGNLLTLQSSTPGVAFDISSSGTNSLAYLNVIDSNNVTGNSLVANYSTDGGGDTDWVFNVSPDDPFGLGSANLVDGSFGSNKTPTFEFSLTDPNVSDTVKYRIQIDNNSDYSSPEIDQTSSLAAQGAQTFTPSSDLADGDYYWRVKAIDQYDLETDFITATVSDPAFKIDTVAPTGSVIINNGDANTTSTSVTLTLTATDSASGISQMILSEASDFSGANYESFAASKSFDLTAGYGTKTVYAKFKDVAGNESIVYSDTVNYPAPIVSSSSSSTSSASSSEVSNTSSSAASGSASSETSSGSTSSSTSSEIFTGGDTGTPGVTRDITVKLALADGTPVSNVKVKIDATGEEQTTNEEGVVSFQAVPTGNHKILGVINNVAFEQPITINDSSTEFKITIENPVQQTATLAVVVLIGFSLGAIVAWVVVRKRFALDQNTSN